MFVSVIKNIFFHIDVRKYALFTSWSLIAKTITMGVGFFVYGFLAKQLGPTNLGILSYSQSIISLFLLLATFNIDHIILRDLSIAEEDKNEIIGTAIITKLLISLILFVFIVLLFVISKSTDIISIVLLILAFNLLLQPFNTFSNFFNSIQDGKTIGLSTITASLCVSFIKIILILANKGIIWIAASTLLETVIYISFYVYALKKYNMAISELRFSYIRSSHLITLSLPLLLTTFAELIYARIDQIMLKHMIDVTSVGLYDVVVRISEAWYFIPAIIISSSFPALARASKNSTFIKKTNIIVLLTLGISFLFISLIVVLSPYILSIFGKDYIVAINALRLYSIAGAGIMITNIAKQILVIKSSISIFLYSTIFGALLNIVLNLLLIPNYGITGAALATLLSYLSVPICIFLSPSMRKHIVTFIRYNTALYEKKTGSV